MAGKITAGPNKMDLMLALFDRPEIDGIAQQRSVTFTFEGKNGLQVSIDSIEREDGSGKSWNFTGRVLPRTEWPEYTKIVGNYSTETRKGTYSCVRS